MTENTTSFTTTLGSISTIQTIAEYPTDSFHQTQGNAAVGKESLGQH